MASVEGRLARIEEQLNNLRADVAELARAVHGPNGSLRSRLHQIESDAAAAKVAAATLAEVRRNKSDGFTKRQAVAVLVFGAVASLGTVVSITVAISQLSGG